MGRKLSIHALVRGWALETPEAVAIATPGHIPLTYARLLRQIEETAQALNGLGLGRNARVAVVLSNGPEAAVSFLAVAACATCAPLNPALRAREFDHLLEGLGICALVAQDGMDSPAVTAARNRGIPVIRLRSQPESGAGMFTLEGARLGPAARSGFAAEQDLALILSTSGTTARAKVVPLTQANVCVAADNVKRVLALSPADRCLNVMPLFHVHGLLGAVLSSIASGGSVICAPGYSARSFPEWLEQYSPTWYTAVPTIHQAVLANAGKDRERLAHGHLRLIRSCSAPLPRKVALELEQVFRVPVIQAYGMTEAAHQIASNPLPPRDQKLGSVGVPVGVEVVVVNPSGEVVPLGERGEITIRGASVTRGYEGGAESDRQDRVEGWLRTGDEGFIDSEGYIFLTGRIKEMINRAGSKIAPSEVDEVLLGHPAVAQVVTFSMPHATLGEEVAAAVVLRKDSVATAEQVRKYAAQHLVDFKVPKRVVITDEIPIGVTGKLQRIGLAERLGLVASGSQAGLRPSGSATPRTPTEIKLAAIWSEILNLPDIGVDANFFEIGGDSLLATGLLLRVSEVFGNQPDLTQFFEIPTIAGQAHVLEESKQVPLSPCLVPIQSFGHNPPFFGVTAGTEIGTMGILGKLLGSDQPFYALNPATLVEMHGDYTPELAAARYIQEIRAVQPKGPYFLGGWCAGATVALEVARGLLSLDEDVALLAVFTPMLYPRYNHSLRSYLQSVSSLRVSERLPRILRTLRGLGSDLGQQIGRRFSRGAQHASVPIPTWSKKVCGMVQEINRRAFFRLSRKAYAGRVAIFITRDELGAALPPKKDPIVVFGKVATGGLDVHVVSGGHSSVSEEPHIRDLVHQFRCCLDKAFILSKTIKKS